MGGYLRESRPRTPQLFQSTASVVRRAGARRKNSSIQTILLLRKGSEWVISHNRGEGCSHLSSILPVLFHWGCCLDVGPQRKLELMNKLISPEKAGRAASRLPRGFVH